MLRPSGFLKRTTFREVNSNSVLRSFPPEQSTQVFQHYTATYTNSLDTRRHKQRSRHLRVWDTTRVLFIQTQIHYLCFNASNFD